MSLAGEELLIGSYGEIALKGGNRHFFERALARGARRLLPAGSGAAVRGSHLEVRLPVGVPVEAGIEALQRCFGLVAVRPARRLARPLDLADVAAAAVEEARRAQAGGARSFKVAARRQDKAFPYTSPELNRLVGAEVARATGLPVDVHGPDLEVGLDIRGDAVYLWGRRLPGPGGLPVGSSGRGLVLLSGGIDSPVAAYAAARRGLALSAAYCHTFPYTGDGTRDKVLDLCRRLAGFVGEVRLWVVDFTPVQLAIQEAVGEPWRTLVSRRMMLRLGEALARRERAGALITGDSLGQVASQTLESMAAVGEVATLPLLRPLVGWDKAEIVALARRIQTYDISVRPFDDCCVVFAPRHPRTRPTPEEVRGAEAALDVASLAERALAGSRRWRVTPDDARQEPPPGADP